jgi:phosphonate transport system ATP-binding protein
MQTSLTKDGRLDRERPAVAALGLHLGHGEREVVRGIDLEVPAGCFLAILGPSGAGKTTLLMALNGSVPVRSGSLEVLGQDLSNLRGRALERFRSRIGFIFQSFHLVGRVPVLHNVASGMLAEIPLPKALLGWYGHDQYRRIVEALRMVGLEDRILDRCDRLSGGQRQRVAIARALVQRPSLILADEPISALDPRSAAKVLDILHRATRELGITVVCSLHHLEAARDRADRVIGLNEGRVAYDGPPSGLDAATVREIYRGAAEAGPGTARATPELLTTSTDP